MGPCPIGCEYKEDPNKPDYCLLELIVYVSNDEIFGKNQTWIYR
jgi:hypothetical protein